MHEWQSLAHVASTTCHHAEVAAERSCTADYAGRSAGFCGSCVTNVAWS